MTPKVVVKGADTGVPRSPSMTGLNTLCKKLSSQDEIIEHLKTENEQARDMIRQQNDLIKIYHEELLTQQKLIDDACVKIAQQTEFIMKAEALLVAHEDALNDIIHG